MDFAKYISKECDSFCITPNEIYEPSSGNDITCISEVIPSINIKDLVKFLKDNQGIIKLV